MDTKELDEEIVVNSRINEKGKTRRLAANGGDRRLEATRRQIEDMSRMGNGGTKNA